jgi:hypothetical protein
MGIASGSVPSSGGNSIAPYLSSLSPYAIVARISCVVVDGLGGVSGFIDSALKYRRSATAHFIVLFQQNRVHQANDGHLIGKDSPDVRAALDLLVEPLERIRAVELALMLRGWREWPV